MYFPILLILSQIEIYIMVAIAGIRKVNKKSIKERYNTLKEVEDGKPNSQVVAKKDATHIDKKTIIRFPKQKRKEIKQCVRD